MPNYIIGQEGGPVVDEQARWLVDAVDDWRIRTEKPRHDPGWFHCSQLGDSDEKLIACYRGVLQLEPHTARELRIFDNGHDRDGSWKRYLKEAGLSVVGEEEARSVMLPYLRLRGSLDDIAHDPATGEMWVIEFKTCNQYKFSQLTEPMPPHILQVHSYMAATSIQQAIVVYENKSDQSVRAFSVPFDRAIWQGIVTRLQRLRREAEALDTAVPENVLMMSRSLVEELAR